MNTGALSAGISTSWIAVGKEEEHMTKAEEFVSHMIKRCQIDGRLAWLIGPMSRAYDLMVEAYAEMKDLNVKEFERQYVKTLKPIPLNKGWDKNDVEDASP